MPGAGTIIFLDTIFAGFPLLGVADAVETVGNLSNSEDGARLPWG